MQPKAFLLLSAALVAHAAVQPDAVKVQARNDGPGCTEILAATPTFGNPQGNLGSFLSTVTLGRTVPLCDLATMLPTGGKLDAEFSSWSSSYRSAEASFLSQVTALGSSCPTAGPAIMAVVSALPQPTKECPPPDQPKPAAAARGDVPLVVGMVASMMCVGAAAVFL